nr:hypothetical protein [Dietzia sp. UCD-THP]
MNLGTEPSRVPVTGEEVLTSGAVVDHDSVFCQAFGFAVVRTSPVTG